ncbi:hypothetical protein [Novipirellula maiorica]|nr:hypothetical protein [Rhodopirellula maiorica]
MPLKTPGVLGSYRIFPSDRSDSGFSSMPARSANTIVQGIDVTIDLPVHGDDPFGIVIATNNTAIGQGQRNAEMG